METLELFTDRTSLVFGTSGIQRLATAKVCVFGLGGVGCACALDLVRCGIGNLYVQDSDTVNMSNLNRLSMGRRSVLDMAKTTAFEQLAKDINPDIKITANRNFIKGHNVKDYLPLAYDFYIDCIDSLNSKVNMIFLLATEKLPFVASMGTAGRFNPLRLQYSDIRKTTICPLARSVRQRLRKFGLPEDAAVPCVWSDEIPAEPGEYSVGNSEGRARRTLGSTPFVPQAAGHILASIAVRHILGL